MADQMDKMNRSQCLGVLAQAPVDEVKQFAEDLIPDLGEISVIFNRTGLVMLPMVESVHGTQFYLGELLTGEARVRVGDQEGYAACLGRDLEQALALAIVDVSNAIGIEQENIHAFVSLQKARLEESDRLLLRQVEATRVEMETFEWQMPK